MNGNGKVGSTELEILAVKCPTCNSLPNVGCLNPERHVLAKACPQDGLSFHPTRYRAAMDEKFRRAFGKLSPTDKALICYYAFIRLADSVSTKSKEVLGREFTSTEVQIFFARKASDELKKDGLI